MKINQAEFISSFSDVSKCPAPTLPEFAFIGRSNVGKSSLINMLTQRKALAKISVRPGKTQTINHFLINGTWYLVDLPGYGYAGVSQNQRFQWGKMIEKYLLNRENLACLFVLADSRLEPQPLDLSFIQWAGEKNIPLSIVMTKTDKVSRSLANKNLGLLKARLMETWEETPPILLSSSKEKTGREEILTFIDESIKNYGKPT